MKAKTKRRLKHLVGRKQLLRKNHARQLGRSIFIGLVGACTASLTYAVTITHPMVDINVHSTLAGKTIAAPVVTITSTPPAPQVGGPNEVGRGSWYALGLLAPDAITCASRTFPRGSYLQVTNTNNGRIVTCHVNDYGPAVYTGRVIDLSRGSFLQVANLSAGTIPVEIRLVSNAGSFRLPLGNYQAIIGYSRCSQSHAAGYCDIHRFDGN